jgi:hypothetical protein
MKARNGFVGQVCAGASLAAKATHAAISAMLRDATRHPRLICRDGIIMGEFTGSYRFLPLWAAAMPRMNTIIVAQIGSL